MEFAVRKLFSTFPGLGEVWQVCFRHSLRDPWTKVLGTEDYTTREEAEQVLAEIEGA